jgi:hypothetical protein
MKLEHLHGGILLRCGVCLQGMSKRVFIGSQGRSSGKKIELLAVLQRGQSFNMCGRLARSWGEPSSLPEIFFFFLPYGDLFPRWT